MINSNNSATSLVASFRDSPGYKGDDVLRLNAALIACTTVIIGLRTYVRGFMLKALGLDDLFAVLALGCVIALSAFEIRSVRFGSGAHVEDVPEGLVVQFFEAMVNNTFIYFFGTGLMRLSIVAFLPRLAKDVISPTLNKAIYFVGATVIAQTVGCFCYRLTECSPVKDIWLLPTTPGLNCVSAQEDNSMMVGHQAIGIIVDFVLLALPIGVIHNNMVFSQQKVQVFLVFSVGIFIVAIGVVRIIMLKTLLFLDDPTFNMTTIGPWTDLEGHVGLWCASFPALQPLIHLLAYKVGLRSALHSYGQDANSTQYIDRKDSVVWAQRVSFSHDRYLRKGSSVDADDGSERYFVPSAKNTSELDNIELTTVRVHKMADV